jgi:hypothetical protein
MLVSQTACADRVPVREPDEPTSAITRQEDSNVVDEQDRKQQCEQLMGAPLLPLTRLQVSTALKWVSPWCGKGKGSLARGFKKHSVSERER